MERSEEDEIGNCDNDRPHVVILGAGASRAAFPRNNKYGLFLPLMNDLVDVIGASDLFKKYKIKTPSGDFEKFYSSLVENAANVELVSEIEKRVFNYFAKMQLPEDPTLYDHLVLSLREKDVIATFNWDPFLMQAHVRNCSHAKMPMLLFLHGNVGVGYCDQHKPFTQGPIDSICRKCFRHLKQSKLLFPVAKKEYDKDPFIEKAWFCLQKYLQHAYVVTIFGYSDLPYVSVPV